MAQRFLVIRAAARLTVREGASDGRRKLREIFDRDVSPIAEEGLRRIAELYRIEAAIAGMTSETRRAVRQARAKPRVDDFAGWLAGARSRVSARSRIGEKLAYFANHWDGLTVFLDDGGVEVESNAVEKLIRPVTLQRRNSLFAGDDEGAANRARIASLIETCKINGVDPFAYLVAAFEGYPLAIQTTASTTSRPGLREGIKRPPVEGADAAYDQVASAALMAAQPL